MVYDNRQKCILARLNLDAGKSSIDLSDNSTAFQFFKHGISFLGQDNWATEYSLGLELFDAAAEAACVLNDSASVTFYSEKVFSNAKCSNDKLNCESCHVILGSSSAPVSFCCISFVLRTLTHLCTLSLCIPITSTIRLTNISKGSSFC